MSLVSPNLSSDKYLFIFDIQSLPILGHLRNTYYNIFEISFKYLFHTLCNTLKKSKLKYDGIRRWNYGISNKTGPQGNRNKINPIPIRAC